MFEQTFKNIDDVLWKEAGCATELDYTEQTSWILFLKYLDDLEKANEQKAELADKKYERIIDTKHRWSVWAAPKKKDGAFDHDKALTGDDLIKYVDEKLFPYLKGFRTRAEGANTIEYKIGEIFSEIENKFRSGYSLRDALELVDQLSFRSQQEKHELSHLYEAKLRNMGNAGRNGGEYYTPRPLIRAMIQVVKPQIGERIYDGACGSAGFLCEAFDYLTRERDKLSTKDLNTLQTQTFYGKEKKSLAYVIGIMNMILHGIDAPNIVHTNTLTENISDIQDKDRFDVVLANPPFGGKERPETYNQNFPIKTSETAFLFLQHFIKSLKAGGRAAMVIKNTFLSNTDNASVALRKELLENCNLHTVLDVPNGSFQGSGVKTVVLFFEKGAPTRNIWFCKPDVGRNLGKTNPLNDDDLKDFVALQARFKDSENSWTVDVKSINKTTYDIPVKNPNKVGEETFDDPQTIIGVMSNEDATNAKVLADIGNVLFVQQGKGWVEKKLGDVCQIIMGQSPPGESYNAKGNGVPLINGPVEFGPTAFSRTLAIKFTTAPTKYCKTGDLILCVRGSTTGRMNIAGSDSCIGRGVAAIRSDEYQEWINHFINFSRDKIYELGTGATFPNVSGEMLSSLKIAIPPRDELPSLIALLNQITAMIDGLEVAYKRRLDELSNLKLAVLEKAFSGQLTTPPGAPLREAAE